MIGWPLVLLNSWSFVKLCQRAGECCAPRGNCDVYWTYYGCYINCRHVLFESLNSLNIWHIDIFLLIDKCWTVELVYVDVILPADLYWHFIDVAWYVEVICTGFLHPDSSNSVSYWHWGGGGGGSHLFLVSNIYYVFILKVETHCATNCCLLSINFSSSITSLTIQIFP